MADTQEQITIDLTGNEPVITTTQVRRRRPLREISSNEANRPSRRARRSNRSETENRAPAPTATNINRVQQAQRQTSEEFGLGIKKNNAWINHIKAFAKQHNLTYWEAIKHPKCKETYKKVKGGSLLSDLYDYGTLDELKKAGSAAGKNFELSGLSPFDARYYLGSKVVGPALLG